VAPIVNVPGAVAAIGHVAVITGGVAVVDVVATDVHAEMAAPFKVKETVPGTLAVALITVAGPSSAGALPVSTSVVGVAAPAFATPTTAKPERAIALITMPDKNFLMYCLL
jgi:hypothetical protein